MANDEAYADGLLNRALDPASQPTAIREFLREEAERLERLLGRGKRVVDFGCGTGRHLRQFASRVGLGIGLDYQRSYVVAASAGEMTGPVHFIVADATQVPLGPDYDLAICTTNTWGTIPNQLAVLEEMRRVAPDPGERVLSVYSPTSVEQRREWYGRLGSDVTRETDEYLETADGFRSEHFTIERLRRLIGPCEIEPVGVIGYWVLA